MEQSTVPTRVPLKRKSMTWTTRKPIARLMKLSKLDMQFRITAYLRPKPLAMITAIGALVVLHDNRTNNRTYKLMIPLENVTPTVYI